MTDDREPDDREPDAPDFDPPGEWRTPEDRLDDLEDDVREIRAGMRLLADRIGQMKSAMPRAAGRSPAAWPGDGAIARAAIAELVGLDRIREITRALADAIRPRPHVNPGE